MSMREFVMGKTECWRADTISAISFECESVQNNSKCRTEFEKNKLIF